MRVRAYDPSIGRFLSRDPLGRAPLFFADNPYVYAGNNPLSNVDPSGQRAAGANGATVSSRQAKQIFARIIKHSGCDNKCQAQRRQEAERHARDLANGDSGFFKDFARNLLIASLIVGGLGLAAAAFEWWFVAGILAGIAAALTVLSFIAGDLQTAFTSESDNNDGWFTKANIGHFGAQLETTLGSDVGAAGMVWLLLGSAGAAMYWGRNLIAAIAALKLTVQKVINASVALIGFAIGYFIVLAAGYAYMDWKIVDDVSQQEGAVLN